MKFAFKRVSCSKSRNLKKERGCKSRLVICSLKYAKAFNFANIILTSEPESIPHRPFPPTPIQQKTRRSNHGGNLLSTSRTLVLCYVVLSLFCPHQERLTLVVFPLLLDWCLFFCPYPICVPLLSLAVLSGVAIGHTCVGYSRPPPTRTPCFVETPKD